MSIEMSQPDHAMERLEDQIKWYDKKSGYNQKMFKGLKTMTIVISLLIPLFAAYAAYKGNIDGKLIALIAGILGALIALLEAVQQLNQYHHNWITYRSTAEALKHEKYLYLSHAGPYASATNAKALLAERVESSVSQEHAKWASAQEQTAKPHNPKGQP